MAAEMMGHVHARQTACLFQVLVLGEQRHAEMGRAFGKREDVVQELVWVLPRLVFFEDGVEDLLFGFLAFALTDVLWRHDFGVHVLWIVVVDDDLVDAEDGGCAGDPTYLHGLVIGLFGVQEPASG
jgi:hypothetical protein